MKIQAIIFFMIAILALAGCQNQNNAASTTNLGNPFIGGSSAIKLSFVPNSPPPEVTDANFENGVMVPESEFDFDVTVLVENVGETLIEEDTLKLTLSGFFPDDFNIPSSEATSELTAKNTRDDLPGVGKDPTGNRVRGDVAQYTFPQTTTKKLFYNKELAGNQQFPFRVEACYPYTTKVLSQVCLLSDLTKQDTSICNPTGSRPVSNSGAPVHITSITQSVAGKSKLLLNFEVRKVGTSELFKPSAIDGCKDHFANKDRIKVMINTGVPNLRCLGLLDPDSGSSSAGIFEGNVLLTNGAASFTCIQDLPENTGDSVKSFQVNLDYHARDYVTTNVLVKHLI